MASALTGNSSGTAAAAFPAISLEIDTKSANATVGSASAAALQAQSTDVQTKKKPVIICHQLYPLSREQIASKPPVEVSDWKQLQHDTRYAYLAFNTVKVLQALSESGKVLSALNASGVFHKVRDESHFEAMKKRYQADKPIPSNWVAKGNFCGIWCALFDKCNTFSLTSTFHFIQFKFKATHKLFDPQYSVHVQLWQEWKKANANVENPWDKAKNDDGSPLSLRIKLFSPADHQAFYKKHGFGAFVGYDDYVALVITDPECIESVTFMP